MPRPTITNPLKYHGGKHYLAKRIVQLMPPHTHYVEPFFGSGAVMFQKDPTGVSEVVNDILYALTTLWTVLRDPELFERFVRLCDATPFSQQVWKESEKRLLDEDPVIRAHAFFVLNRQSRQGLMNDFATLSRNRVRRKMNEQASSWLSAVEGLPEAHERLKRVVVLNRDALAVIGQQDGPDTFFYLDPPYLHDTRVTTSDYEFEMGESDHSKLLELLCHIEGKFILSGYPSGIYDEWERAGHWQRVDIEIDNKASSKKTKQKKTECLWMNFTPPV